jgi:ABC-2 type transport system ATP-binding protein
MMVSVWDLVKVYNRRRAVNGISFSIEEGAIFGFLGPNGAGKTTSIRMMTGLIKPTSGGVAINGKDVVAQRARIYPDIGVVFESQNLYLKFTIRQNLKLFADLFGVSEQRLDAVMDDLQLSERSGEQVGKLSKGWRQRVLIARALLHGPRLLFLDEPTSGLDPNTASLIHGYIKKVNAEGTTVVLTTHNMHEADELSSQIGVMHNGRLVALGSPEALKREHAQDEIWVEYRVGDGTKKDRLPVSDEAMEFVAQLQREVRVLGLQHREGNLADVFATLTGGELN